MAEQGQEPSPDEVKCFHLVLKEKNGEQEYSHDTLIIAHNLQEAEEIAKERARSWYDTDDVTDFIEKTPGGDRYGFEFFDGQIDIMIMNLSETTRKNFANQILENMTLNPNDLEIPKPKTLVVVGGGCLRSVYSAIETEVELIDYDEKDHDPDFDETATDARIEQAIKSGMIPVFGG